MKRYLKKKSLGIIESGYVSGHTRRSVLTEDRSEGYHDRSAEFRLVVYLHDL